VRRLNILAGCLALLAACTPAPKPPSASILSVYRLDPPALIQLDSRNQPDRVLPLTIPDGCAVNDFYPAPHGFALAIEFNCAFGQAVVWMNAETGQLKQAVTNSDSHFLAWAPAGDALYLKADTINRPHVVRVDVNGGEQALPISELTYDLAPSTAGSHFLFAFSRGMGLGSELWLAQGAGQTSRLIAADGGSYLSLARWSPDGSQIAIIKIPDSATPFTVGGLWVMRSDGGAARQLAPADAGHGYPPAWSPDGSKIAFVVRENPGDPRADQSAQALISNLHLVDVADGTDRALTSFASARVGSPAWQPDGNNIAFTVVVDDKMTAYTLDSNSGRLQPVGAGSVCCPAWLRR
jgi:dipeptidyl aminopeptidase/acylaminoacyl peptidase